MALKLAWPTVAAAIALVGIPFLWPRFASAAPVKTANAACEVAKSRASALWHFPVSKVAFCDSIDEADSPRNYFVLGLHGKRYDCGDDICGSTLMGWLAVEKSTGRVFEWKVEGWKVGPPIKERH